jgi:murein DD-endopeptidase MepM/ murein hydrolase activator NlpD
MEKEPRRMTFIVVPHGARDENTRSFEVSYRRLKVAAFILLLLAIVWAATTISWTFVAGRAAQVPALERELAVLRQEQAQVQDLALALRRLEGQYMQMRDLLGANRPSDPASIWLPPIDARSIDDGLAANGESALIPRAWPLTQRGFVTQEHLGRIPGQHPGIDIAVAEGNYVRASAGGLVTQSGEDEVYGKFVRIRHADGYETVYGHASELFVAPEEEVEPHQVIALSGNTGSSTAPHLHFEVWKDGIPVDPREVVDTP